MKAIGILTVFFASFFFNVNEVVAQRYFVYDSDAFNVMVWPPTPTIQNSLPFLLQMKTKRNGLNLNFSHYLDYEDTETGGFTYKVKDGVGSIYWIEDFRTEDYIVSVWWNLYHILDFL